MEYGKEMHGTAYNATLYKEQLIGDIDRYISMFQSMFPSGLEYAMLDNPSWPVRKYFVLSYQKAWEAVCGINKLDNILTA